MDEFGSFFLTIISGSIVAVISLLLAGRQRRADEKRAEAERRAVILNAVGSELRWNRVATRGNVDATNAHIAVGAFTTVAFERFGAELASIAPESIEPVFEHYALIGRVREGIRNIAALPNREADEKLKREWIQLSQMAGAEVSNSAGEALRSLDMPLE